MSAQDLSVTAHITSRPVSNNSRQHTTCPKHPTSAHDLSLRVYVSKRPVSNSSRQPTTSQ